MLTLYAYVYATPPPLGCCCLFTSGEADSLHSIINLHSSISDDASAESANTRRQALEKDIRAADQGVSLPYQ
jgi:hypothetical protein